jgi:D-glycero-D-manno-heptose 1,7-bisphosphate phosphatase
MTSATRQAVILVGGKGTRLGALTANTPKPLMPLDADTVFLDEVIFDIARHGFDDVVLAAGHFGDQLAERYDGRVIRGARVRVVVEREPAGTGGALREAEHFLAPTFLLANGDTVFDINLRRLDSLLNSSPDALGCLALRQVDDAGRYGSVELQNGRIRAFREKVSGADGIKGLINGGIGVFRRGILDLIDRVPCSLEADVYPEIVEAGRLLGHEFQGYFLDIGLPETLAKAQRDLPFRRRRPATFFDRDGVINVDRGYTWRVNDLVFVPGAIEAIRAVNDLGALAVIVTNQAGVARGYYRQEDIDLFHGALQEALFREGAHVDAIYSCPYHPEATITEFRHPDHPDRKPNPGMLLRALREWPIEDAASFIVGDKQSDLEAGRRAGIRGILYEEGNLMDVIQPLLREMGKRSAVESVSRT